MSFQVENKVPGSYPGSNWQNKSLLELLTERDELTAKTGCYYGCTDLTLREENPLKFERFYFKLLAATFKAREVARYVAASPGGREMGESLFALTTPEGDAITLGLGFFSHIAAFPVAIRFMIQNNYEENPGINDGDLFSTDDGLTGGAPHPGDTYNYMPIVYQGQVVGWAVGLNHIMEAGAPVAGSWPGYAVDTFMDGFVFPPTKIGEKEKIYRWWEETWKRRTRASMMNILDDKMRLAGASMICHSVFSIIDEFGLDYYMRAIREIIEEGRRVTMDNIHRLMIPARLGGVAYRGVRYKGLAPLWSQADKDSLIHIRGELSLDPDGKIFVDFEGSSRWGYHAFNGYPGGADCSVLLGIINSFSHSTKVSSAPALATRTHYPKGSIYNPDTPYASYSNIWAQSMAMNSIGFNAVSRALFAKGYLEEAFTADGDWNGSQGSGILADGTPYGFTNFEQVGGAALGAFCYKDGQPLAYAEWTQLCNIGNAEEMEYLIPPLFYVGRSVLSDYCGHGKYRGGLGLTSAYVVFEAGQRLSMSRGGAAPAMTAFIGLGNSGGYPAPGMFVVTLRNTNFSELVQKEQIYPRDPVEAIAMVKEGRLKAEKVEVWNYDPPELSLQDGDLWFAVSGAGGGWGDPIERDPQAVIEDLNKGWVSEKAAQTLYAVVFRRLVENEYELDPEGTKLAREQVRQERKARALPAKEWWIQERNRVIKRELTEPIRSMYADNCTFEKYREEFYGFWQLNRDFNVKE